MHLDTRDELGEQDEVEYERRGEQRVLARVVQRNGVASAHEYLVLVLVERSLAVANRRHVLDDHDVVGMRATDAVEQLVRVDHVVDHVAFADLLAAELGGRVEIEAVVVAQVVVAGDGERLDARRDEEVDEHALHLGLAALEVVAAHVHLVRVCQLQHGRHERVLRTAVDERALLEYGGDGEHARRADLGMVGLDRGHQVGARVVDARDQFGESLRVRCPQDDHLVEPIGRLELAYVGAQLRQVLALVLALDQIVGTLLLIGRYEIGIVDARQRTHGAHVVSKLADEVGLEHLRASHGTRQVHAADVPAADDQLVGLEHGHELIERHEDVLARLGRYADLGRAGQEQRAEVVGVLHAAARLPAKRALVGEQCGGEGRAVVAAPADEHEADAGHAQMRAQRVRVRLVGDHVVASGRVHAHTRVLVHVLGTQVLVVDHLG